MASRLNGGHSFRLGCATLTTALANVRASRSIRSSGKRCGWIALSLDGLLWSSRPISSASISSTMIVSVLVSWPDASSVIWSLGDLVLS
jgi:hypothetical protein